MLSYFLYILILYYSGIYLHLFQNFGPAYLYNICYMHIFITLDFLFMASEPLLRHRKILKN